MVRAKHAHAWGEAYVPVASDPTRSAFEVFDPTPAAPTLAESRDRTVAAFFDYLWTSLGGFYDLTLNAANNWLSSVNYVCNTSIF